MKKLKAINDWDDFSGVIALNTAFVVGCLCFWFLAKWRVFDTLPPSYHGSKVRWILLPIIGGGISLYALLSSAYMMGERCQKILKSLTALEDDNQKLKNDIECLQAQVGLLQAGQQVDSHHAEDGVVSPLLSGRKS